MGATVVRGDSAFFRLVQQDYPVQGEIGHRRRCSHGQPCEIPDHRDFLEFLGNGIFDDEFSILFDIFIRLGRRFPHLLGCDSIRQINITPICRCVADDRKPGHELVFVTIAEIVRSVQDHVNVDRRGIEGEIDRELIQCHRFAVNLPCGGADIFGKGIFRKRATVEHCKVQSRVCKIEIFRQRPGGDCSFRDFYLDIEQADSFRVRQLGSCRRTFFLHAGCERKGEGGKNI